MREVFINRKRVDVTQNDGVDFIYESPIFSDISKIKSNRTTTYTLPKTAHNLGIFRHADQHDVISDQPYQEWDFEEYRNGLPIIQNGKCRLLKIVDKIELAVVWGITVALTEKLAKKLNEVENDEYVAWGKKGLVSPESKPDCGLLVADFGMGAFKKYTNQDSQLQLEYIYPSASVDFILRAIAADAEINLDITKETSDLLKKKWIPCVDKKANELTWAETWADFEFRLHYEKSYTDFNKPDYDPYKILGTASETSEIPYYLDLALGLCNVSLDGMIELKGNLSAYKLCIDFTSIYVMEKKTQEQINESSRIKFICDLNYQGSATNITTGTISSQAEFNVLKTDGYEMTGESNIYVHVYLTDKDGNLKKEIAFDNRDSAPNAHKVRVKGKVISKGVVLPNAPFPIMLNLPDMTCIDFIKSICQMYGLFPYFDLKNKTLKFVQIDDIYKNVDKAKNWDNKVIGDDWSIERSFGDYAKRNRFSYMEDETVETTSQTYLELDNALLTKEKDFVDLKFTTTDMREQLYSYATMTKFIPMAYLPCIKKGEDTSTIEYQTIKPRILSENLFTIVEASSVQYKSLTFDSSMKLEGKEGLVEKYYKKYKDVVEKPVLREVSVYFSDVELMTISPLDIIYLRGKYWMPMKTQVSIDGKAKVNLILLPAVFN